jgi:transposase
VRLANLSPCLIAMEACVGAHHLSRKLQALGHDARLMPAKYVHPYNKGHKNDFPDVEDRRLFQHCRRDFCARSSPGDFEVREGRDRATHKDVSLGAVRTYSFSASSRSIASASEGRLISP